MVRSRKGLNAKLEAKLAERDVEIAELRRSVAELAARAQEGVDPMKKLCAMSQPDRTDPKIRLVQCNIVPI